MTTTVRAKHAVGQYGEELAARLLTGQGLVVLDRNWRCKIGEIDLVLRDGDVLVVCEVKTRTSTAFGHPLEAVNDEKADRLRALAQCWVEGHDVTPRGVRIDLVGVLLGVKGPALLEHVRGID